MEINFQLPLPYKERPSEKAFCSSWVHGVLCEGRCFPVGKCLVVDVVVVTNVADVAGADIAAVAGCLFLLLLLLLMLFIAFVIALPVLLLRSPVSCVVVEVVVDVTSSEEALGE